MATKPINCPYDKVPGFNFFRGNLVLDDGSKAFPSIYMELSDISQEIQAFSKSKVSLKAGSSFLLTQTDVGDEFGYVSFIAVKATFPNNTVESKKYLTWAYEAVEYKMGTLMILSGKRLSATSSIYEGWLLSKPGTYSQNGGILFSNPHINIDIKLEILVAR